MEIKIREYKEKTINIEQGSFWKEKCVGNSYRMYKILNKTKCLQIDKLNDVSVSFGFGYTATLEFEKMKKIDRQTFETAAGVVVKYLSKFI